VLDIIILNTPFNLNRRLEPVILVLCQGAMSTVTISFVVAF
jgi:hypothetical protein